MRTDLNIAMSRPFTERWQIKEEFSAWKNCFTVEKNYRFGQRFKTEFYLKLTFGLYRVKSTRFSPEKHTS